MTQAIRDLTDKIWRQVTQGDSCDPSDIGALIGIAHDLDEKAGALASRVAELEADKLHLTESVDALVQERDRLSSSLDKYDHLTQFAEETVEP